MCSFLCASLALAERRRCTRRPKRGEAEPPARGRRRTASSPGPHTRAPQPLPRRRTTSRRPILARRCCGHRCAPASRRCPAPAGPPRRCAPGPAATAVSSAAPMSSDTGSAGDTISARPVMISSNADDDEQFLHGQLILYRSAPSTLRGGVNRVHRLGIDAETARICGSAGIPLKECRNRPTIACAGRTPRPAMGFIDIASDGCCSASSADCWVTFRIES